MSIYNPITNPRFVYTIGDIHNAFKDIPERLCGTAEVHLYDRQEKKIVLTVKKEYRNAICLQLADDHSFDSLAEWFNELDREALESEGIPATK